MKPRVLIVEDEPAIADNIQYALETEGFDTLLLSSGMPVIDLLSRERIDLVILDIGLPDINGLELCKLIRKRHSLPIIFLTARSDEVDRVVGLEIGGDDYVTKPFSPRELSARVKAILRRVRPTEKKSPSGPFEIDAEKRRIFFFGVALDLSRYEYRLLKVLINRPGQVFTRDRLMEIAWDEPEASMDRTVDAHIKNLRAKLKAVNPDVDPITTHRGTGYALRDDI
jgi:two-component system, OmpR family, catabolic regulation response regulator CreB